MHYPPSCPQGWRRGRGRGRRLGSALAPPSEQQRVWFGSLAAEREKLERSGRNELPRRGLSDIDCDVVLWEVQQRLDVGSDDVLVLEGLWWRVLNQEQK